MAYNYKSIQDFDPSSRQYYFFDTNVWLAVLQGTSTNKAKEYINLFNAVIDLNFIKDLGVVKKLEKQGVDTGVKL